MSSYKCIREFVSTNRRRFFNGQLISEYEYNNLTYSEKNNFQVVSSSFFNFTPTDDTSSSIFSDSSSSDSSSSDSSFDFGGGDSGGGGASGDW
jgi:uncharacterized membrane protein YgcG